MLRLPILITVAWWGVCLGQADDIVMWWRRAGELWRMPAWRAMLTPALTGAAGRHAILLVLAAAGALAFAGLGGSLVALVRPRRIRPWERHALAVLFGFACLGSANFGLALCGLGFGPLFVATIVAGLALPGARGLLRQAAASRAFGPPGGWWWVLGLAPLVPVAAAMLMPDGHVDVLTYHLAIPDQILRVHKFTAEGAPLTSGSPLTAEFVYAIAIVIGRDEYAHWLQAAPFLASVLLLAGWTARRAGTGAGWAAGIAILTCAAAGQQLTVAKNDLAAAAFAMTGALGLALALGLTEGDGEDTSVPIPHMPMNVRVIEVPPAPALTA